MTEQQISDLRRIQQAFNENRLDFVDGRAIIREDETAPQPHHNQHPIPKTDEPTPHPTLSTFIQNEHNASKFYHSLSIKAHGKQKEILQKLSKQAKKREQDLTKIHAKQNKAPFKPRVPNINTNIEPQQGIQWAIEVEHLNINTMLNYKYKNRIINVIQSKMADQSLLLLALFYK